MLISMDFFFICNIQGRFIQFVSLLFNDAFYHILEAFDSSVDVDF